MKLPDGPYGYRLTMEIDPGEQAALDTMRQLRSEGFSYQKIADALIKMGLRTRRGNLWSPRAVYHHLDTKQTKGLEE